jgi:hypothetical protein
MGLTIRRWIVYYALAFPARYRLRSVGSS